MHIDELTPRLDLAELYARKEQPRRTLGVTHVSDILRWMDNRDQHRGKRPPREQMPVREIERLSLYASMGYAWENIIREALAPVWNVDKEEDRLQAACAPRWIRPGEIHRDGIYGNPDWLDLEEPAVEEFKATYKSARRDILGKEFWTWFPQVKAYCYMLSVWIAYLRVFFVCGDWQRSGPLIKMWRLEFRPRELEDNWQMLLINAEAMQEEQDAQRRHEECDQALSSSADRPRFASANTN